jgi:hypothetical protein
MDLKQTKLWVKQRGPCKRMITHLQTFVDNYDGQNMNEIKSRLERLRYEENTMKSRLT